MGKDLVERFVEALESGLTIFFVDRRLEDPTPLTSALKQARVGTLLDVGSIMEGRLIYIALREKPCETSCMAEECRDRDPVCLDNCKRRCLQERARMVAEKLAVLAGKKNTRKT